MSKRIISDITWKSKKVRAVQPPEFRPEYAWLMPIFEDNGVAELDAESIWSEAYGAARPGWDPDKVQKLIDELIRVGLYEKYDAQGKTFIYLVGSDKPGHLPPPSQRYSTLPLPSAYGNSSARTADSKAAQGIALTGIGTGSGSGLGTGTGNGTGTEQAGGTDTDEPVSQAGEDQPKITFTVVAALESLGYTKGAPLLSPEQYAAMEKVLVWAQFQSRERWAHVVEAIRWGQTKSNYWGARVIDQKNIVTVEAQYEKFYSRAAKKPHEIALAEAEKTYLEGEVAVEPGDEVELPKSKAFELED